MAAEQNPRQKLDRFTGSERVVAIDDKSERAAVFGFPDVWNETFRAYELRFHAIDKLQALSSELVSATKTHEEKLVSILNVLTDISSRSMTDVIILVGNKRDASAMKIARGMFEVDIISGYLEKNPQEVDAYSEFSLVQAWRYVVSGEKHSPGSVVPEFKDQVEAEYNRAKGRFTDAKGRVAKSFSGKSIRAMAEELGRLNLYELAYSSASDLHHVSFVGIIGHELDWSREALDVAHGSLLQTVASLYNVSQSEPLLAGFHEKVTAAITEFNSVRQKRP